MRKEQNGLFWLSCHISVEKSGTRRKLHSESSRYVVILEELFLRYFSNDHIRNLLKYICKNCFICLEKIIRLRADLQCGNKLELKNLQL